MILIRVNYSKAEQRFELKVVVENIGITSDQGFALALVRRVDMQRVPPVLPPDDLSNTFEVFGTLEIIVPAVQFTVRQVKVSVLGFRWHGRWTDMRCSRVGIIRKVNERNPPRPLQRSKLRSKCTVFTVNLHCTHFASPDVYYVF